MRDLYRKLCKRETFQPRWAGVFLNGFFLFRRGLFRTVRRHGPELRGVVVDLGCGEKPYRELIPADIYIGLDMPVSGHADELKSPDIYFDGRHLPLRDAVADCVIATEVFEHVFDLPALLEEIRRVLKPGGRLFFTCPFCWNEHEVPYDFARYTRFALHSLLSDAGFQVVAQEKIGPAVHALFQMVLVYCHEHLRPRGGAAAAVVGVFYNTVFNSFALVLGKILPAGWDFYLGNVCLAEKPAESPERVR